MNRPICLACRAAVIAAIAAALPAWAGSIRHDRDVQRYQALGARPEFRCVGQIVTTGGDGKPDQMRGSAVVVAPRWVLTARHVVDEIDLASADLHVAFDGARCKVVRIVLFPKGAILAQGRQRDLALLELDGDARGVAPAERFRGRDEAGRVAMIVGHGTVNTGLDGVVEKDGGRLAGRNVIDAIGGVDRLMRDAPVDEHLLLIDLDHPTDARLNDLGDDEPLDLEMSPSGGDSGGAAFIQCRRGEWLLAGIVRGPLSGSREWRQRHPGWDGIIVSSLYGVIHAFERVSMANDWIDEVLAGGS